MANRGKRRLLTGSRHTAGSPGGPREEAQWLAAAHWATALLSNGHGRYAEALTAAEQGSQYPDEFGLATWSLVELVEAAVRSGLPRARGGCAPAPLCCRRSSGSDWTLGVEARSRALLTDGEFAEHLYREAIERLGRTCIRAELARARLLYGEWLRRENRRVEAREQLQAAYEVLTATGITGFAERARRELLATGRTARKRTVDAIRELTPQETQVARLAGAGRTNAEISTELFISPRTVEWHLRKVFAKLGISSRRQLRGTVPDLGPVALPA